MVSFNYSKLEGKIKEMYGTQMRFSEAMNMSERTLSLKLNNKLPWKQTEILRACDLLKIGVKGVHLYFFAE